MVIVMIGKGKGSDSTRHHGVVPFKTKEEAEDYIFTITDITSKHYTVAEIVEEGKTYEADREGFVEA